jgi:transposase InsO family protein
VPGVTEANGLLSDSNLRVEQSNDPILQAVMKLKADPSTDDVKLFTVNDDDARRYAKEWKSLFMEDGLLQRSDGRTGTVQVVIPKQLRTQYVKACHAECGHMGLVKTAERLCRRAYFPGWKQTAKEVCNGCGLCAERCRGPPPRRGAMQTMEVDTPMERIQLDLVGPNPSTPRQNQWILTMIDSFSRYLICVPLRTKEARHVAAALHRHLFAIWGLCKEIYHDQGREFDNSLIKCICSEYGIRDLRTSPFRAQSNGRCERVHRTMHDMLSKVVAEDQKDWDLVLSGVTAAYNSSVHESTGYTPNMLMTGREALTPLDLPLPKRQRSYTGSIIEDYHDKLRERIRANYAEARRRSTLKAAERKRRYDLKVRSIQFSQGDKVLVRREVSKPGLNIKWRRLYGPYTIVTKLGPVDYIVAKGDGGKQSVVHADRLRHWRALYNSSSVQAVDGEDTTVEPLRRSKRILKRLAADKS